MKSDFDLMVNIGATGLLTTPPRLRPLDDGTSRVVLHRCIEFFLPTDLSMLVLILGFIIGFFIAIPAIGPISATVVQRSLRRDFLHAFSIGAGSSLAEAIYCYTALVGVSLFVDQFIWLKPVLRWVGVVVLLGLGAYFLLGNTPTAPDDTDLSNPTAASAGSAFSLGFLVTILNPSMLATWTAAIAYMQGLDVVTFQTWHHWSFPLSVVAGELTWFVVLVSTLNRLGHAISDRTIAGVIRTIGGVLIALGIWGIVDVFV